MSFFIPAAWWFRGKEKRILIAISLAFAGLLLHIFYRTDFKHLEMAFHGSRSGLGMQIPLTGLLSSTALMATIVLGPRIRGPMQKPFSSFLRVCLWLVLITVFLEILVITQSITSWIAFAVVAPPLLLITIHKHFKLLSGKERMILIAFAVIGIAGSGFLLFNNVDTIKKRLSYQQSAIKAISSLDFNEIPYKTSFEMRLWTYRYGIEKWLERPLFGWGPGVEVGKLPGKHSKCLTHMHNMYLEILIRFGITGLVLIGTGIWIFFFYLREAYLKLTLPFDLFLFFLGILGLLIIWSAANFMMMSYWHFYCVLYLGMAYSFCIQPSFSK